MERSLQWRFRSVHTPQATNVKKHTQGLPFVEVCIFRFDNSRLKPKCSAWGQSSQNFPMQSEATLKNTGNMMMSWNGNIFRVTGPLCGEFTGPGEFPTQRPVTRSFDVFFDLRLNKRLSKQPWGWWFGTLSWSLWRHRNDMTPINPQWLITQPQQNKARQTHVYTSWGILSDMMYIYLILSTRQQ